MFIFRLAMKPQEADDAFGAHMTRVCSITRNIGYNVNTKTDFKTLNGEVGDKYKEALTNIPEYYKAAKEKAAKEYEVAAKGKGKAELAMLNKAYKEEIAAHDTACKDDLAALKKAYDNLDVRYKHIDKTISASFQSAIPAHAAS